MVSRLSGRTNSAIFVPKRKAANPTLLTLLPNVSDVKLVPQSLKENSPMVSTSLPIVTDWRLVHWPKEFELTVVTPSVTVTEVMDVLYPSHGQLDLLLYSVIGPVPVIVISPVAHSKEYVTFAPQVPLSLGAA